MLCAWCTLQQACAEEACLKFIFKFYVLMQMFFLCWLPIEAGESEVQPYHKLHRRSIKTS
jgi:hypothetical protein